MKLILYVSKVVSKQGGAAVPSGLTKIYNDARKKNRAREITGVLSFREGRFIQAIEGEDSAVDDLFSKIRRDQRHSELRVLINQRTYQRYFPGIWMKLLISAQRDPLFLNFSRSFSQELDALPLERRQLFDSFCKLNSSESASSGFNNKELQLSAWPDFTVIKQSPIVVELCARLTQAKTPYNNLLNSGLYGKKEALDSLLYAFESLDILKVSQTNVRSSVNSANINKTSTDKFYLKMKSFLGFRAR